MTAASASHRLLNFVQSALLLGLIAWIAVTAIAGPENGLLMALAMGGGLLFAPRCHSGCSSRPIRRSGSPVVMPPVSSRPWPNSPAGPGCSAPALYRVPSRLPNAFALGRPEDSAICVTHRLLDQLDGENSPGFWRMRSGISPTANCGS